MKCSRLISSAIACVIAATFPASISAQTITGTAVRGVAFDSLHGTALVGATIILSGSNETATSDKHGIFQFSGVVPGAHIATLFHDVLDSIGLPGIATRFVVSAQTNELQMAIPSFATLWHAACGAGVVPRDSGFIFGSVKDAVRGTGLPLATVELSFIDLGFDKATGVVQQRWSAGVRTDASGSYTLCGLPTDVDLRMLATHDSASSGTVNLAAGRERVRRRDLFVRLAADSATKGGVVSGRVVDAISARPADNVRVLIAGADEVRTRSDGRFMLRDVPLGTRELQLLSVGSARVSAIVDVTPRDTANLTFSLVKVTTLEKVKVTARSIRQLHISDMEHRRAMKFGTFLDSTAIAHWATVATALATTMKKGACAIYIDNVKQRLDTDPLRFMSPLDIAVIEVHEPWSVPIEYTERVRCNVILVWTKLGLP
ncbi:MAG: carboxypeptidase regulatory-like domain-containing protein [Gemmatimonadaceae bacterium]